MKLPEPIIPAYYPAGGSPFRTDTAILCTAINYLAATRPDSFGGTDFCASLRADIDDFMARRAGSPRFMIPILPYLHDLFTAKGIAPFKDVRLAFLGGEDFFDHSVFGAGTTALRESFAAFRDFHEYRLGNGLTADRAPCVIARGKYDIVLSGNVMNFPEVPNVKSVFAACANLLKKEGLAIHAVDYSRDHYDLILSVPFHKVCGQKMTGPVTPRIHPDRQEMVVDYIALTQRREVRLSDKDLDVLEKAQIIPRPMQRDNFAPY